MRQPVKMRTLINLNYPYAAYAVHAAWLTDALRSSHFVVGVFDVSNHERVSGSDWFRGLRNWPVGHHGHGDAIVVVAESYATNVRLRQFTLTPDGTSSNDLDLLVYEVEMPELGIHLGCVGVLLKNGWAGIPLDGDNAFLGHVLNWVGEPDLLSGPLYPWASRVRAGEHWSGLFAEIKLGRRNFWFCDHPNVLMHKVAHLLRDTGEFSIKKAPVAWLEREPWAQAHLAPDAVVVD